MRTRVQYPAIMSAVAAKKPKPARSRSKGPRVSETSKAASAASAPVASRPQAAGYGISEDAKGLLPWSWAEERLAKSRQYFITTVRPDSRPHTMPVWGIWIDDAFWFSTGRKTQKAHNLARNQNCTIATEASEEAVILEGVANEITDAAMLKDALRKMAPLSKKKYGMSGGPPGEPIYRVQPRRVFGLVEKTFPETATRWTFES